MMPGAGRFMQADRWGGSAWSPWQSHPFIYVNNNPMVFVDPYGLFTLSMSAAKSGFVSGFKNEFYSSLKSGVFNAVVKFASTKVPIVGQAMFVVNMIRSAQGALQTSQLLIDLASGNISDKEISTMIGEAIGEQVAQLAMSAAKKGVSAIARKVQNAVKAKASKKAKEAGDDKRTKNTKDWSSYYRNEREARALAREKIGHNPIEVSPGKYRSQNGKWQYRAKLNDLNDKHIHLEELNPETGEVLQNYHLRWK
jgi:hypothetical protein